MFISLIFDCVGSSLQSPGSPVEACEVGSRGMRAWCPMACRISDPQPGIESTSPALDSVMDHQEVLLFYKQI